MGRAPCCDKSNVKKGPWSPDEDANLKTYIEQHGTGGNWIALPHKIGLKRCGKSCRLRWLNYLRPNIKHGGFSDEEDNIICSLYMSIGSRWSIIAAQLPGRTDNDIKNYWNTRLKKKLLGKQRKQHARRGGNCPKEVTRKSTVENLSVSNTNVNQAFPLWQGNIPVLPIPYSNHEPQFNDHASMRTLLVKLGGKFSDDDNKYQTGQDTQVPLMSSYGIPNSIEAIPPCSSMDALNLYESQISGFSMLPVDINIPTEFERVRYDHHHYTPQKLDGLEFLYNTASGNSVDWGEMSNLGYPSIMPNYEGTFQEECGLDNLKYAGVH